MSRIDADKTPIPETEATGVSSRESLVILSELKSAAIREIRGSTLRLHSSRPAGTKLALGEFSPLFSRIMSDRLADLEIKLTFLERHVGAQDKAMLELHEEVARLRKEIAGLRTRVASGTPADDTPLSADDERPPHY